MAQCAAVARSTGQQCKRRPVGDSDWCGVHQPEEVDDSLSAVAASGDRLATLRHLRQTLTQTIDAGPPPRDLAALARRLQVVLTEIEELAPPSVVESKADELARRRSEREAAG